MGYSAEPPDYGRSDKYKYNLSGEAQINPDGTARQELLSRCKTGDKVKLVREPDNIHDYYAIAVCLTDGQQIGWIPKSTNRNLASHLDLRGKVDARIYKITGGPGIIGRIFSRVAKKYGCLIEVTFGKTDWSLEEPLQQQSDKIQDLIDAAKNEEKNNINKAIDFYKASIQAIKTMDAAGPAAIASRRARYPVNRLSLALVREKRYQEALDVISEYDNYADRVGLVASDDESIAKRKAKLRAKLERQTK